MKTIHQALLWRDYNKKASLLVLFEYVSFPLHKLLWFHLIAQVSSTPSLLDFLSLTLPTPMFTQKHDSETDIICTSQAITQYENLLSLYASLNTTTTLIQLTSD